MLITTSRPLRRMWGVSLYTLCAALALFAASAATMSFAHAYMARSVLSLSVVGISVSAVVAATALVVMLVALIFAVALKR